MEKKETIRLVHVTTISQTFMFFRGQIGFLKERGFEIDVVSSPGGMSQEFSESEGVAFHPVAMTRAITPREDLRALVALWRLFRKIRPDIVHSHTPKAGFLGTLAARCAGVPVVFSSVFGLPQMTLWGWKKNLFDFLTRLECLLADRVWTDSLSIREYVTRHRLCSGEKSVVLGNGSVNGVDAERVFSPSLSDSRTRREIRARLGIPQESVVLGYVGRIVIDKGLHELAEAWRALSSFRSDLHLLLLGSWEGGPLPPEDEHLFRTDPRIHLAGWRTEVPAYLAAMDIFVMPSYREGFGITNIEASAMELPIVSTRIPGCVDSVKDGVTGTLVPAGDVDSLIGAIRVYLNDPELRRRHGRAGRERVLRDFRPEFIWEDLHKEYWRLLKNRGR
jgi:glycosyltransferase involved in cell wall biosynthesis